jgi:hypothetical protein
LVTIALFVPLVQVRQYAEDALGGTRRTGPHRDYALEKDSVRYLTATMGTGRELFTGRHDILRKKVLETRTKEGGASVKDFTVSR